MNVDSLPFSPPLLAVIVISSHRCCTHSFLHPLLPLDQAASAVGGAKVGARLGSVDWFLYKPDVTCCLAATVTDQTNSCSVTVCTVTV